MYKPPLLSTGDVLVLTIRLIFAIKLLLLKVIKSIQSEISGNFYMRQTVCTCVQFNSTCRPTGNFSVNFYTLQIVQTFLVTAAGSAFMYLLHVSLTVCLYTNR